MTGEFTTKDIVIATIAGLGFLLGGDKGSLEGQG